MTITIRIGDDDAVPCTCKFRNWTGHDLVIVANHKGKLFHAALKRAGVNARLREDDGTDEPPR